MLWEDGDDKNGRTNKPEIVNNNSQTGDLVIDTSMKNLEISKGDRQLIYNDAISYYKELLIAIIIAITCNLNSRELNGLIGRMEKNFDNDKTTIFCTIFKIYQSYDATTKENSKALPNMNQKKENIQNIQFKKNKCNKYNSKFYVV